MGVYPTHTHTHTHTRSLYVQLCPAAVLQPCDAFLTMMHADGGCRVWSFLNTWGIINFCARDGAATGQFGSDAVAVAQGAPAVRTPLTAASLTPTPSEWRMGRAAS